VSEDVDDRATYQLDPTFPWIRRLDTDRQRRMQPRGPRCGRVYRCHRYEIAMWDGTNERREPAGNELDPYSFYLSISDISSARSLTAAADESACHLVCIATYIFAFFPHHFNTIDNMAVSYYNIAAVLTIRVFLSYGRERWTTMQLV